MRGGHEVLVYSRLLTDQDPCFFKILQHVPHVLDFLHGFAQNGPAKYVLQFPDGGFLKHREGEHQKQKKCSAKKIMKRQGNCMFCAGVPHLRSPLYSRMIFSRARAFPFKFAVMIPALSLEGCKSSQSSWCEEARPSTVSTSSSKGSFSVLAWVE